MKKGRRRFFLVPAGLVFVPHVRLRDPDRDLQFSPLTAAVVLDPRLRACFSSARCSRFPSVFCSARHSFIFSEGEGRRKGITLSLDVCFRRHLRDLWAASRRPPAPPWRARVGVSSSTRGKTRKRNSDGTSCKVQRAC